MELPSAFLLALGPFCHTRELMSLRAASAEHAPCFRRSIVHCLAARLGDHKQRCRFIPAMNALKKLGKHRDGAIVSAVSSCLDHQEPTVRTTAVQTLCHITVPGDGNCTVVLGRVTALLEDDAALVRRATAEGLMKLAEKGDPGIAALIGIRSKSDADYNVRCSALVTLAHIVHHGNADAIRLIGGCMGDSVQAVRDGAVNALLKVAEKGDTVAITVAMVHFEPGDPHIRCTALRALEELVPRGHAAFVSVAVECLRNESHSVVRRAVVRTLTKVAEKGQANVIDAMAMRLLDNDNAVQDAAVCAFSEIVTKDDGGALSAIVSHLENQKPRNRCAALRALVRAAAVGNEAAILVAAAAHEDQSEDVRKTAGHALAEIAGPGNTVAISRMGAYLKHAREDVRLAALRSLTKIFGQDDLTTAKLLVACLEDEEESVRRGAELAVLQIQDQGDAAFHVALVGEVTNLLEHSDEKVQRSAVGALARVAGKGSAVALPIIVSYLGIGWNRVLYEAVQKLPLLYKRGDPAAIAAAVACLQHVAGDVRSAAVQVLLQISKRGDAVVVASLERCLEDAKAEVRQQTLGALADISEINEAGPRTRVLEVCLKDACAEVRCAGLAALPRMVERGNDSAVSVAIESLQDYSGDVRRAACLSLTELARRGDHEAVEAVRIVEKNDDDPRVQNAAARALVRLEVLPEKVETRMREALEFARVECKQQRHSMPLLVV